MRSLSAANAISHVSRFKILDLLRRKSPRRRSFLQALTNSGLMADGTDTHILSKIRRCRTPNRSWRLKKHALDEERAEDGRVVLAAGVRK